MPHTFVAPFMDLAMFGLHGRVPDPKTKQDEAGVPPTRPAPPQISRCISWCAVVGSEVQTP